MITNKSTLYSSVYLCEEIPEDIDAVLDQAYQETLLGYRVCDELGDDDVLDCDAD